MNRDALYATVDRLRKEAIGDPVWNHEKQVFEYPENSARVVATLKIVRATHGITALDLLCNNGLFIDLGVTIRCVNDCASEVYFLLEEYPKASTNVTQFVNAFFESTIDGYLTTQIEPVQTKKIRSAAVRVLKDRHDDATNKIMQNIYKTFSGYVHANYAHIMEVYGGNPLSFNFSVVPSVRQRAMRMEAVDLAANSVMHTSAFAAYKFGLNEVFREAVENFH